jgi:hypothetical protein
MNHQILSLFIGVAGAAAVAACDWTPQATGISSGPVTAPEASALPTDTSAWILQDRSSSSDAATSSESPVDSGVFTRDGSPSCTIPTGAGTLGEEPVSGACTPTTTRNLCDPGGSCRALCDSAHYEVICSHAVLTPDLGCELLRIPAAEGISYLCCPCSSETGHR